MEILQWIFLGPAKLIALWPYAGVAIAAGLIAVQALLNVRAGQPFGIAFLREAAVFAGLLWLIFNAYELQIAAMAADGLVAGGFLRLDLIVLAPILYALTFAAGISLGCQLGPNANADTRTGIKSATAIDSKHGDRHSGP